MYSYYEEIIEGYKKQSEDSLNDLNAAQLSYIAAFAHESGHSNGIRECINYMYDYVRFARDILKAQTK